MAEPGAPTTRPSSRPARTRPSSRPARTRPSSRPAREVTALAGGVGAARLLRGLVEVVDPAAVTAVVNVADDTELYGLHVSPDLDTVLYTLADLGDAERGWGLAGETWTVMDGLRRLGEDAWFNLGDRDLATHLARTGQLRQGRTLSEVTAHLAASVGVAVELLPATDDPVRTRVTLTSGEEVAFQDYFVRLHHDVAVRAVRFEGADVARPGPGVLEAIGTARRVIICPSNPVVSIGPILATPGLADALRARRPDVVAVSPLVAGQALKGPADRLMTELGLEASAVGVASFYAEYAAAVIVDHADAVLAERVEAQGVRCIVTDTIMSDPKRAAQLAKVALDGGA